MKEKIPTAIELSRRLDDDYKRWCDIFHNGCSDPNYCDGVNISLVRSHIQYDKKQIEKHLGENYLAYPDSYFFPLPIDLPQDFMAVERESAMLGKKPENRYNYTRIEQVMIFDWKEALA